MKKAASICFCGLFVAAFFAISNLMPPIQIIPGIPLTLQIFVITLMTFLLDFKYSFITYVTILVMTLCGIPMMSGLSAGIYVFTGPTAGYIYGWLLHILIISAGKKTVKKIKGIQLKTVVSVLFGTIGVIAVYLCGSAWLAIAASSGLQGFLSLFGANIVAFLMLDVLKIIAGYACFKFLKKII